MAIKAVDSSQVQVYTSSDLRLYFESPFASWMEHYAKAVPNSDVVYSADAPEPDTPPATENRRFVGQLRQRGHTIVEVDPEGGLARRQMDTVNAMGEGTQFIFDPWLVVLPMAGSIDFLMRNSGRSVLGDFHYLPARLCQDTGELADLPIELCLLVDMLEQIQGVSPEEIIQITEPNSANPHINRVKAAPFMAEYRALRDDYLRSQREFDPNSPPPNPAQSRHFGRWTKFAEKILARQQFGDPAF